jgi:hypothetical protein
LLCAKHFFIRTLLLYFISTGYSPIDQRLTCSDT